jgi:glycerol-3-phosphate O-acyltransferase
LPSIYLSINQSINQSIYLSTFFIHQTWSHGTSQENVQAPAIRAAVLSSSFVQTEILRYTERENLSINQGRKYAAQVIDSMLADVWTNNVRSIMYIFRKVWREMYEGIFINDDGIEMVRELAKRRIPIILLPTHKSHMDYLMIHYICFAHNLPVPHVVAGDNLRIPIVGSILRHGGAMFIRYVQFTPPPPFP